VLVSVSVHGLDSSPSAIQYVVTVGVCRFHSVFSCPVSREIASPGTHRCSILIVCIVDLLS
jgi:hypothetical protein